MIRVSLHSTWVYVGPGYGAGWSFRVAMFTDGDVIAIGMQSAWLGSPDAFLALFRPIETAHK